MRFEGRLPVEQIGRKPGVFSGRIVARMLDDALAYPKGQVEAAEPGVARLEVLDDAQGVEVVIEAQSVPAQARIERPFARVPKWRMADVVHQRECFRKVMVQPKRVRNRAGDLRDLHSVRQARAEVIGRLAGGAVCGENLCFAREPTECACMDDPGAIPLKRRPIRMPRLGVLARSKRVGRIVRGGTG